MTKSSPHTLTKPNKGIETDDYARFLKKRPPFTPKEGLVFYGLVKFPGLNDQQLSRKLKIKRSTVTAIRNKLRRQNFYTPLAIPNFQLLGYELMTFIWGKSSLLIPLEEKMKIPAIKKAMQAPETVFQILTDTEFFSFLIFKNFTEFKKMENEYAQVYKKYPIKEPNLNIVHFPFETSKMLSLFDYSLLLKKLLKAEFEEKTTPKQKTPKSAVKLKEGEKIVLGALIKYPELNDTGIAKKINITRQTFSKTKAKLVKQGAIKLVNEPNFKKIGCELFVNTHTKFNPLIDSNTRRALSEKPKKKCPMAFDVESDAEEVCASFFGDYLSFKIVQDELERAYKENDLLLEGPTTQIIPMPQVKVHETNFISVTERALNIKIP